MQSKQLGNSPLSVTPICLGTMTFGEQNTEAQAHEQLDYAVERGINFIDTAEMYPVMPRAETQGRTEQYLGTWLKKSGHREQLVIASKIAGPSRGMGWIRNGNNDFSPANLRAALDTSLQRLQTDYIDLYQLHWPSRNAPIFGQTRFDPTQERAHCTIAATVATLDALIKEGKIRAYGVSNETAWGIGEFSRQASLQHAAAPASIQNAYNLMNRAFEQGIDESCYRENIGLLAYSPLAFGQLSGKYAADAAAAGRLTHFPPTWSPRYLRAEVFEASRRYAALAHAHGMTPARLALAWCYSRWFVASTIIGATTLAQLEENINAFETVLSPEVLAEIEQIHRQLHNPAR